MPQPQQVTLKVGGLYTSPNDFSGVPEGSLDIADNVVIDHDNLLEPRRGFTALTGTIASVNQFTNYQSTKIVQYSTNSLAYYSAGAYHSYAGTYAPPDTSLAKCRFVEANRNLYLSTSSGIYKLDSYSATPALAGIPKGLDLQLAISGSSGFFSANVQATVTCTTTSGAATLTKISDLSNLVIGQYVSGSGITAGTTISSIGSSATALITTGTTAIGSTSVTAMGSIVGLSAGMFVTGTGILSGTRITGASGTTVTLDTAAVAAGSVTLTFATDPVVTMSANASASATVSLDFGDGAQVGYRMLWGIRDANNNLLYGSPSQFASVTNNLGASRTVDVTFSIPSGITVSHFYQIYRSPQTAAASITPLDEEQLVYESNPSSGDLSNGYITMTDITPDSLRGADLYTGINQEGISQSNEPPPFAKDFCFFRNFGIFANVKGKQTKKITILAVGGSSGIAANDTLTIGGIVFTAKTSETAASGYFKIFTAGTPAQNIADTANSLIKVINRYATNTVTYAYLLSGPTDTPGQILLQERGTGASAFVFIASAHGAAYSPTLPTSGTTITSAQDTFKNGIMVSKPGQFEAVPTVNIFYAGSASQEILRVIPLREYVVILKQDGIYRLTGTSLATMLISPFDLTTKLLSPDSAVSLSNEVWGFFDQGVCSVSDTGVNVRSRPIETDLRSLIGLTLATIKTLSFGIGYETDRKYILFLPSNDTDTTCTQQYVFNTFTSRWTRWTKNATAGFIDPVQDLMYLGSGASSAVVYERKDDDFTDYVDEAFTVTISSFSTSSVVLVSADGINEGDILYQSSTVFSTVTAVDLDTATITMDDSLTWTPGTASILPAIQSIVQWKPVVAGNPAFIRQYSEGLLICKRTQFREATVGIYSDASQSLDDTTLTGFVPALWGMFGWGEEPWGGVDRPRSLRFLVPQDKQMCSQLSCKLTIQNGYAGWAIEGISLSFTPVGQEVGN